MSDFQKACKAIRHFGLNDMDLSNVRDLMLFNMERGLQKETAAIAKGEINNFSELYKNH